MIQEIKKYRNLLRLYPLFLSVCYFPQIFLSLKHAREYNLASIAKTASKQFVRLFRAGL